MAKYLEPLRVTIAAIILGLTLPVVQADEHRHHEAHEHGVAQLNIAIEGNDLHMEFTSPAANIVGFEHQPRTPEQKGAVRKAMEKLEDGSKLFIPSSEAQCRLSKSSVKTDIEHDAEHEGEHGDEHDAKHGHEDEHNAKHRHKDEHDAEHEHEGEDDHARHSEFEAEYRFVCQHPEKLSKVEVVLIQAFPGIEHIEVQLLTETKQTAMELTAKENKILF